MASDNYADRFNVIGVGVLLVKALYIVVLSTYMHGATAANVLMVYFCILIPSSKY